MVTLCLAALLAMPLPRLEPPDPKTLAALAMRIRLPMPGKDAPLVLAYTGGRDAFYTPAFLLEEKADGSIVVLRGLDRETVRPPRKGEPVWRKFSLDPVDPKTAGYEVGFGLESYVCAVQVAARGDLATARGIIARFDDRGRWFGDEDLTPEYRDPRMLLGELLVEHWWERIPEGAAHWKDAHAGLEAVLAELPFLASEDRLELLADLSTTLRAKAPAANSTEALLLDWGSRPADSWAVSSVFRDPGPYNPCLPARAVVARGFDAVPDLIALLDDRRVTTHMSPPFNRIPASNLRVGHLARQLLGEMTCATVTPGEDETDSAAWRAWWAKNRVRPEREFFLGLVFELRDGKRAAVRAGPAHVLAQKHPASLPGLCAEFWERAGPDSETLTLAEAVANSALPKAERVKALVVFSGRGTLGQRLGVLRALAPLDSKECAKLILPLVEKLPKDADGPAGTNPGAALGAVVARLEDDAVWRAYLAAARRSAVGQRLEMLAAASDRWAGPRNRERRLAFLAAFLDDEAVVNAPANWFVGFRSPQLTLGDHAALYAAPLLGLDGIWNQSWDAAVWADLRRDVRAALAKERLPDFGAKR